MLTTAYLLVNFGGPRSLEEIEPFLRCLLTDREVIRSKMPPFLHDLFFSWIARKRAQKIIPDYQMLGGSSPIYRDTEQLACILEHRLGASVIPFHRYLPATHETFIARVNRLHCDTLVVFPLFPQFSYATTGSIARFFHEHFAVPSLSRMQWIRSYFQHPSWVDSLQRTIRQTFESQQWKEEHTLLLFSPHGLPQSFIDEGDPYQEECRQSFRTIASAFPRAHAVLAYQSQFGKQQWIGPSTLETCSRIRERNQDKRHVMIIPLSFTSDHLETLVEVEHLYLPILRGEGFDAIRCPALNLESFWIESILAILQSAPRVPTVNLLRTP